MVTLAIVLVSGMQSKAHAEQTGGAYASELAHPVCYHASVFRLWDTREGNAMSTEILLMWATVTAYAVSTVLFVVGVAFERAKVISFAVSAAGIGLAVHVAAVAVRWARIGRGPMLGYYEMTSKLAIIGVALFLILVWRYRKLAPAGVAIMPVSTLLIAAAMMSPKGALNLTGTLASYWLLVHITFANLAFGAFVVSFGLAIAYVIRERAADRAWGRSLDKLPSQEIVDHLSSRFVFAGFIFWGIMIASGAIWANEAWGSYWSWDPIETWSLVVWLIYAIYLHLRFTLGWRGEKISWVAIGAMPVALFCLAGIPLVYHTVHSGYLAG